jgi:hypothetical protein
MTLKSNALVSQDEALTALGQSRKTYRADFFSVYNDGSGAVAPTAATVQVTSANIILTVTGGTNASTSTISLTAGATDTIGELITAIEALAKGWVCNRETATSQLSSGLASVGATACLLAANEVMLEGLDADSLDWLINAASSFIESFCKRVFTNSGALTTETIYINGTGRDILLLPNFPVANDGTIRVYTFDTVTQTVLDTLTEHTDYEVDFTAGALITGQWSNGFKNIKVTYSHGYTTATMPWDLKNACLSLVNYLYSNKDKVGMNSERIGGYSYTKETAGQVLFAGLPIPGDIILMLNAYRRLDYGV